jgi:hypothetical protein
LLAITPVDKLSHESSSSIKTPKQHAMEFIIQSDLAQVIADDTIILQWYALTTFFYAVEGTLWSVEGNWLSNQNICTWVQVNCEIQAHQVSVTSLSLNYMNLNGLVLDELSLGVYFLEEINLSNNSTRGSIPASLAQLNNLRILNLAFTQISRSLSSILFSNGWMNLM